MLVDLGVNNKILKIHNIKIVQIFVAVGIVPYRIHNRFAVI